MNPNEAKFLTRDVEASVVPVGTKITLQKGGIKIPVNPPENTVKAFAAALVKIKENPEFRISLARSAQQRAQTLFRWDEKFRLLQATYEGLIKSA